MCRKSWISFRSGVCNRFQDVAAKKVTSSHYSQQRESVALLDCGMHVVGCSWKQDQVISRGMQGACAGSGMLERAGRMHLVCAGCSRVYYFIWCYYYYSPLAHSGGCGEWDCAPHSWDLQSQLGIPSSVPHVRKMRIVLRACFYQVHVLTELFVIWL